MVFEDLRKRDSSGQTSAFVATMLSIAASSPVSLLVGAKTPSSARAAVQMNQADITCGWATEPYARQFPPEAQWQRAAHDGTTSYDCRGNVRVDQNGVQMYSDPTPDVKAWATEPYGNQASPDTEFHWRAAKSTRGNIQVAVDGSQVAPTYGAPSGGTPADVTCGWATEPYGRQGVPEAPFHQRATLDGTLSPTCVGNVQLQDEVPMVGNGYQMVGGVVPTRGMGMSPEEQAKQAWLAARA